MPADAKWSMRKAKHMLFNINNFTFSKGLIPKFMSKVGVPIVE